MYRDGTFFPVLSRDALLIDHTIIAASKTAANVKGGGGVLDEGIGIDECPLLVYATPQPHNPTTPQRCGQGWRWRFVGRVRARYITRAAYRRVASKRANVTLGVARGGWGRGEAGGRAGAGVDDASACRRGGWVSVCSRGRAK